MTDKDLAKGELVATFTNTPLFAGDSDTITEEAILDTGNLAKYTVVGRITATGKVVQWAPGASDGSQLVCGVLTQAANATSEDIRVAIYTAGFFNDAALVWPVHASADTFIERRAAMEAAGRGLRLGSVRL